MTDTITIRQAKPTLEEGKLFAEYFDAAAEGFFSAMLGKKAYSIIAEAYVKENNEYSYKQVLFAEYNSKIVGMVSGFTYDEAKSFNHSILKESSSQAPIRIMLFRLVGNILKRFLGGKKSGEYYIEAIAVNSEFRGKGIGSKLLCSCREVALKKRATLLSLDVSSKNSNAIKLYEKIGMRELSHWPKRVLPSVFTKMGKSHTPLPLRGGQDKRKKDNKIFLSSLSAGEGPRVRVHISSSQFNSYRDKTTSNNLLKLPCIHYGVFCY